MRWFDDFVSFKSIEAAFIDVNTHTAVKFMLDRFRRWMERDADAVSKADVFVSVHCSLNLSFHLLIAAAVFLSAGTRW